MNDHIPDLTKMISDTPICDGTPHNVADLGMLCRKLEREMNECIDRIKRLLAERDTARQQADQKISLREEFHELLGTDDIEQGITVVCDLKQLAAVRLAYIDQLETENDELRADLLLWGDNLRLQQRINRLEEENEALRADLLLWHEQEVKP